MRIHGTETRCACLAVAGVLCLASRVSAETENAAHHPRVSVQAVRTAKAPTIDGRLAEEAWALAPPVSAFVQQDPDEGHPATEATEIRVLYDDEALYVGARLFDHEPGSISRRLSRRDDDPDADTLTIYLDPMHDHLTGAYFRVSAAGVQKDAVIFNDTWDDPTWDAVWESAVSVDGEGWSAEIRIPFSQLRFPAAEDAVWGVNVSRLIYRKNETDWLELVPKKESGLASRMAHLTGLNHLQTRAHFQALPYTAAKGEFIAPQAAGDPFNSGSRASETGGVDVKWGVTSSLTLDATVNPDFGQVEVDPAVVNLTAFETFFDEKRPFFLEGSQIFGSFGRNGANSYWGFNMSDPTVFYSRRIGRSPQLHPDGDFVDAPGATTILGAVKLTRKSTRGWTFAFLDALTAPETARVESGSARRRAEVEPGTNYFVGRMQRGYGDRFGLGLIVTAVLRGSRDPSILDTLATRAYVAGGDAFWFLTPAKEWVINGRLVMSRISGSQATIGREQRLAQRYFQRPDRPHLLLDDRRTSLTGFTGRFNLNRNSGLWQANASLWGVSPGFESNDLGFLSISDRAGAHAVLQWRKVLPDRFTRFRSWWIAKWWTWNFNREIQGDGVQGGYSLTFHNYWNVNGGASWRRRTLDDRLTRGGVSAISPASGTGSFYVNTDSRKWLSVQGNLNGSSSVAAGWSQTAGATLTIKPSPMFAISVGPQLTRTRTVAQYVKTMPDSTALATFGERDVFADLHQTQLSVTSRVSAILTPRVSLQVYAQPLISAGKYDGFKELASPRSYNFLEYGQAGTAITYDPVANNYLVEPGSPDAAPSFSIGNPDFNLKSLRLNAIFRWELKPGSTFYAVWTRQQQDHNHPGDFRLGRDATALFSAPGDNIVLLKIVYWIGR